MENTNTRDTVETTEDLTLGATLQQAREALGMSTKDMARRLRLRVPLIEALEQDDYSSISTETFAKGYLRSYARIVNLNEDDVIHYFNEFTFFPKETVERHLVLNYTYKSGSKRGLLKWLTVGMVLVMMSLMYLWWHDQSSLQTVAQTSAQRIILPLRAAKVTPRPRPLPVDVATKSEPSSVTKRDPFES